MQRAASLRGSIRVVVAGELLLPLFRSLLPATQPRGGRPSRGHDHCQPAPLQPRKLLDLRVFFEIALNAPQELLAEILMGHLAAPEPQCDLDLVSVVEKAPQVSELDLIVPVVGARPELDFLDLSLLLLAARRLSLLALLKLELAVIHQSANRRIGVGGHLDHVEPPFLALRKRLFSRDDAELGPVLADQPKPLGPNFAIYAITLFRCDGSSSNVANQFRRDVHGAPRRLAANHTHAIPETQP